MGIELGESESSISKLETILQGIRSKYMPLSTKKYQRWKNLQAAAGDYDKEKPARLYHYL